MEKPLQRYLALLEAESRHQLEDRVVATIKAALGPDDILPIRLSSIARKFLIEPRPELISGRHDGEIEFVPDMGTFVIRLCSSDDSSTMRQRFTYAHEFAHRFFFVRTTEGWKRALDITLEESEPAARLRARRILKGIEEALCNSIARRVLIPDEFIASHCHLHDWFESGETFSERLEASAKRVGVSRQALLIRIHGALPESERRDRYAFTLEYSKGNMTRRGAEKLRIGSGLFPSTNVVEFGRVLYPGADIGSLSPGAQSIFLEQIANPKRYPSALQLPLRNKAGKVEMLLDGWCKRISSKQLFLWGTARTTA